MAHKLLEQKQIQIYMSEQLECFNDGHGIKKEPPDSCQEVTNTNAIQFLHSDQG